MLEDKMNHLLWKNEIVLKSELSVVPIGQGVRKWDELMLNDRTIRLYWYTVKRSGESTALIDVEIQNESPVVN